jgi:hypothetical protein
MKNVNIILVLSVAGGIQYINLIYGIVVHCVCAVKTNKMITTPSHGHFIIDCPWDVILHSLLTIFYEVT